MKKASPVRLSLRKLFIAMLAVGPISILPSPLLATIPAANGTPFTVIGSGTASFTVSPNTLSINASDRAILSWSPTAFTIGTGETFSFNLPSNGAVLNKVGYGVSGNDPSLANRDNATINGTLTSFGKVYVLANGNINVGAGSILSAQGGVVLSTLSDTDTFTFGQTGNLALTGAALGNVTIGGVGNVVTATGNLALYGLAVAPTNLSVAGDFIVNQKGGVNLDLTGSAGNLTVGGNLSVTSNSTPIIQGTSPITMGNTTSVATFNTTTSTGSQNIILTNPLNDFQTVMANAASLNISDSNSIVLSNTTLAGPQALVVTAVGNITTNGTVTANGTVILNSTGPAGTVTFANNSTALGTFNATAAGNVTANVLGNLTSGNVNLAASATVNSGVAFLTSGGAGYTSAPTLTFNGGLLPGGTPATAITTLTGGAVTGIQFTSLGSGYTSAPTAVFSGGGSTTAATAGPVAITAIASNNSVVDFTSTGAQLITGVISAGSATLRGTSITALNQGAAVNASGPVVFTASAGSITLPSASGSRLEVTTTSGGISQFGGTSLSTSGGPALFNAGAGGAITLTGNNNNFTGGPLQLIGSSATINARGNNTTIGGSTIAGNLTINTVNQTTAGAGEAGPVILGAGFGSNAQDITVNGSLNINTNGGAITEDAASVNNIFGSVNLNTAPVSLATAGNVSFTAAQAGITGGGRYGQFNVTGNSITLAENTSLNLGTITGNSVTVNSTAGDILINGTMNATTFSGNANAGSILEGPTGIANISGVSTFRTSNSFGTNLSTVGNTFGGAVTLTNGLTNIIVSSSNFTLAANSCVTGANATNTITTVGAPNARVTILNGNLTRLTVNSGADIVLQGGLFNTLNLTANDTSASSITQNTLPVTVNGTLTLSSLGNVVLSTVSNNLTGSVVLNNTVGDTAVFSARNLTISGNSTGNLTAVAGTALAGNATNTFSNPWNLILGNLNVKGLNGGAMNGNTTVLPLGSIALVSGGSGYTAAPTVTITGAGTGATATATIAGGVVTGVTLTNPGAGYLVAPTISFTAPTGTNGVAATAAAATTLNSPVNGNILGGNVISGSSGPIVQLSGATLHVENAADLVTYNNNIQLANTGNSFGRVQAATSGGNITPVGGVINYGSGEIMITEDSTLKIGNILTAGNATLTSRFGSVIEDSVNDVNVTANGTSSVLTLTATNGSVQLGGLNRTSGNTTGNFSTVNITAAGSAQIRSTGNLTLGPISANSLNVTANNIAQSAPLNIFGLSTFSTNLTPASGGPVPLTGSIALPNTANNFGPLSLTVISPTQSIAVSENATLNLRSVSMNATSNGTFTVNSVNGDIIDTGLGGAKLGGGSGIVTLAALNGNITLDDPTSDIISSAGVTFNAKNVTLSVLGTPGVTLALGALNLPSSASGNLTVSSALGNIGNAGPLSVGGQASFQTGTGSIAIGSGGTTGNVGFGTLRFVGNQVSIAETGNMDILTGSTAFGPANLISGGSITIVDGGPGTVTFGNIINMSATGNITLSRMQAAGQLTVLATGTKNLSALSLSTDLNGRTPLFGGTGANVDPAP